jgi:hypothetical protein
MATIGIIDDREIDRRMIVRFTKLGNKEKGWEVVDSPPFESLDDYPSWIASQKISALIIDERLDEAMVNGRAVSYQGHDLVDFVREHIHTLPIFVITAHITDALLQDRFKDVEDIIDRRQYGREYPKYVPRIIRSAQKYTSVFEKELSQLSSFAQKMATGETITEEERSHAEAIRTKLGIAFPIESISDISNWVDEAGNLIQELEDLRKDLEQRIGKDI